MHPSDDIPRDDETGTDLEDSAAARAVDLLALLTEALALVPGCRSGAAKELGTLGSVLELIIPHMPDGFGRATLERAHHAFAAETIDPMFAGGVLDRVAATLIRLQKDHVAMRIAPGLVRAPSPAHEPESADTARPEDGESEQ